MLNPAVIEKFLKRPLDSFEWVKKYAPKAVSAELAIALPGLEKLKLWTHQGVALLIIAEIKRFMLHMDMGSGKTLTTLALITSLKAQGQKPRAIVFVPYITSVETWVEECAKHTPDLKCVPLVSTTANNLGELCNTEADLFVICYQSAVAMVTARDAGKWKLKASEVREYFDQFNILVCDEIHRTKNVSSLTYRMCRAISAHTEYVLGLTGTPFGRDLTDLWAQFYLIDFGETLGPTLGFYREVFFAQKRGFWTRHEFKFKQKMLPVLKRMIKHRSIAYSIDELIDLPPKVYIPRTLRQPDAAKGYCDAALKAIKEGAGKKDNLRLIESNYLQLRQLSSGYMTLRGDDDDRVQVQFEDNPKLEALMDIIESMPHGCKAVVFHHFVYSNALISKRLKEAKVKHARVWGGQKNNTAELRRFRDDPKCTVLVINTRSGSSSLNLQFANYCIFFESPDSPIDRQQAERRVWRPGQTKRVLYYDLLVKGTVDHRLHGANQAGETLLKKLLRSG